MSTEDAKTQGGNGTNGISIKPYYEDPYCTIYNADCFDVMAEMQPKSVDLVLTDPPYGIDGSKGQINLARAKGNYEDFKDNAEFIQHVAVPAIKTCIRLSTATILTCGYKNMMLYPQPDSFGCFYQPASVGLQPFGNGDSQPILYYGKNPTKKNMGVPCSYILTERPIPNGHPCPKPYLIWKKLVANFSLPHHTILDPFMGSGTTLRAAKDLNRKSIGIEISEKYCEIAAKRCSQEVLQF